MSSSMVMCPWYAISASGRSFRWKTECYKGQWLVKGPDTRYWGFHTPVMEQLGGFVVDNRVWPGISRGGGRNCPHSPLRSRHLGSFGALPRFLSPEPRCCSAARGGREVCRAADAGGACFYGRRGVAHPGGDAADRGPGG